MPLPAHLPALTLTRLLLLLAPAVAWAADGATLASDGSLAMGQPLLRGGDLVIGAVTVPLDRVAGSTGPASPPRWLDQGVMLVNGDQLRGTILGLQQGTFQMVSDLLGPLDLPVAEVAVVALAPQLAARISIPSGFSGALLANGDRLPGTVAYLDAANVGIDNGRKVVAIPKERVSAVVLHPRVVAEQPHQVARLANGDRVVGRLKAWGPAGLDLVCAHGAVHCAAGELAALWSEGAAQRPFTSLALDGVAPGTGLDALPGGAPLAAGPRRYGHGLGLRGAAQVSARCDGAFATLVGEVSVREGRATLRVLADGKIAWDSGVLSAADPAKPFAAPIAAAKQVQIAVVPADEAASLTVVGWPTLVK